MRESWGTADPETTNEKLGRSNFIVQGGINYSKRAEQRNVNIQNRVSWLLMLEEDGAEDLARNAPHLALHQGGGTQKIVFHSAPGMHRHKNTCSPLCYQVSFPCLFLQLRSSSPTIQKNLLLKIQTHEKKHRNSVSLPI